MPAHSHTQQLGGSISTVANVPGNYVIGNANNSSVTSTGGGSAHNNLQPFTTVNYLIRL
jgi:microcystin-dependent protein